MNADVARTLIPGQKIKYWDGRIATVTVAYTPPAAARGAEVKPPPPGLEAYATVNPNAAGEVGISFDDMPDPKPVHYLFDYDFRLAEPL